MSRKSISNKSLNFETHCPNCKTLIEGEIVYSHIKKLVNNEEIEIECNNCSEDVRITKKIIKKSLDNLSKVEISELNDYINYKPNIKKKSIFDNEYLVRFIFLILFFLLILVYNWYQDNSQNISFINKDSDSSINNIEKPLENQYLEECLEMANDGEPIPITKSQITFCGMNSMGELEVKYNTLY